MKLISVVLLLFAFHFVTAQKQHSFIPGEIWKDTKGNVINAHGGGILYHKGTYYWYGEIKKGDTWLVPGQSWECYRVPAGGVSCYSSRDLFNWKYEGIALAATTGNPDSDLDTGKVIERPKVIYNTKTKKFVLWVHLDSKDYVAARSGVAIADKPQGPYKFVKSERPNASEARDMTIFQDDDGKAYHFFSSESNATMHICLLSDDYLSHTTIVKRILISQSREAPAVIKYNRKYYLITSGCTGWSPNPALYATADSVLGEWHQNENPCIGDNAHITYGVQSTYIQPVPGKKDAYIFLADKWNKTNLPDSRYVWLPMIMKDNKPQIEWKDQWNFSVFK
jgi:hypothetical protein